VFWDQASEAERSNWADNCLERVEVGSDRDVNGTSSEILASRQSLLGGSGESDQALAQRNFANWYTYYRNRWFTLQTVMSRAVADLNPAVRLTYQSLDQTSLDLSGLFRPFGPFDDMRRGWFHDWLFSESADAEKRVLTAAVRVFDFCSQDRAYYEDPQSAGGSDNPIRACRNQFHLIFSDGGWSDGSTPATWLTNNDGTSQSLPAGEGSFAERLGVTSYPTDDSTRIYWDRNAEGLADIVFHSWVTDLRPEDDLVRTVIPDPVVPSGEAQSYVFWNPANDPADWQHITTFTVGLGLTGNVSYPSGDYAPGLNIRTDGFPGAWTALTAPGSGPTSAEMIDDLWHAGINGRGGHSTAQDPDALLEGFRRILATVSETVQGDVAVASPTFSTGGATASTLLLQATLDTSDWTGDLRAYRVSGGLDAQPCPEANRPRGELCEDPAVDYYWSLADQLDGNPEEGVSPRLWTTRRLFSATVSYASDGTKTDTAIAFGSDSWNSLSEDDQRALLGLTDPAVALPDPDSLAVQEARAVMDFIAGKDVADFRNRPSLVGDIINGAPVIVGAPSRTFQDQDYPTFARDNQDRQQIAYVGANDGLLRAVALDTGAELFAYVPRPLFGKLAALSEPGYGSDPPHTNYVDGPIAEGDAYFGTSRAWGSVVVGALGAGAQAVYAIRSPSLADASNVNATDIHLWDFTDRDDLDMGSVFGKPAIVRVLMSDGTIRWVAIFGNGYNSSEDDGARQPGCDDPIQDNGATACGKAVLYVVDIETGRLIAKLDTRRGRRNDPRHSGEAREPNGLGQPTVVGRVLTDSSGNPLGGGDPIATIAYAGDLFGNLWRFDLTEPSNADAPTLIFQARDPNGIAQPITAPVVLAPHPTGEGTLVLFGTGRYLGQPDVSDLSVQSFYGVWDRGGSTEVSADALLEQSFLETGIQVPGGDSSTVVSEGRTSTRNPIDWSVHSGWRLDLVDGESAQGERVVSAPQLRGGRVVFASLIPEPDPCRTGGSSWLNAVSYTSGSALEDTPFDFDLSGTFDSADLLVTGSGAPVAGTSMRLAAGTIFSSPAALVLPGGETMTLLSTSEGDLVQLRESSALRWRVWSQIR
jgi:type IV pilus assembly protein PilY1